MVLDYALARKLFRLLSDDTRLKIVAACLKQERSVTELTAIAGKAQPTVSINLRLLETGGMLRRTKKGRHAFYTIEPAMGDKIVRLLGAAENG